MNRLRRGGGVAGDDPPDPRARIEGRTQGRQVRNEAHDAEVQDQRGGAESEDEIDESPDEAAASHTSGAHKP